MSQRGCTCVFWLAKQCCSGSRPIFSNELQGQAWWLTPVILTLGRQRLGSRRSQVWGQPGIPVDFRPARTDSRVPKDGSGAGDVVWAPLHLLFTRPKFQVQITPLMFLTWSHWCFYVLYCPYLSCSIELGFRISAVCIYYTCSSQLLAPHGSIDSQYKGNTHFKHTLPSHGCECSHGSYGVSVVLGVVTFEGWGNLQGAEPPGALMSEYRPCLSIWL